VLKVRECQRSCDEVAAATVVALLRGSGAAVFEKWGIQPNDSLIIPTHEPVATITLPLDVFGSRKSEDGEEVHQCLTHIHHLPQQSDASINVLLALGGRGSHFQVI
jgi:hypothetical protein